ncbi:type I polyketide synthase [Streptomyces aidingensis]|uniref:Acyl transferase domain-containing protein n=1 Tax=Streptomyces aidingensis TaxID=910347 RepID=A0A1I1MZC9_9ACTN|nr:type I polyketide synthase [Streptomyces aidingensis]SFC87933.1 Acyl transferase domain-containing protein [Streptomyces aidingensis]
MAAEDKLRDYLRRVTVDLTDARRRLAEADARDHEPIAVIGMSCRFPGAEDVDAFWDLLREGRAAPVGEVPVSRFRAQAPPGAGRPRQGAFLPDVAGFDAEFFGFPPQEALRMDPQQRLLMELAWEAMEDAGTPPPGLAGSRTGVLLGFSDSFQYGQLETEIEGRGVWADPYLGQGGLASVVAGRIAYHFDLRGPAFSLDTACSSALVAVHQAVRALRAGECDQALAGGVYLALHPFLHAYSSANALLSPTDRCHTFDTGADGYLMGEGGGLVMLARLSDALREGRRVRAVIRGSAVNQDGRSNGLTAPNRDAQVDVIRRALAAARVAPGEVAYLEAHGSGTALGDEIELGALHEVFGGSRPAAGPPLRVGAVKTNVGHTHTAAGIAGLIKTVLVLEHGRVPPNLHMTEPADVVHAAGPAVRPAAEGGPLAGHRADGALGTDDGHDGGAVVAGVSSFGWSGTNAHVVLETAPPPAEPEGAGTAPAAELLPVSAAGEAELRAMLERLSRRLDGPGPRLADVAHTLQSGRGAGAVRRAVVATGREQAAQRLAAAATGEAVRATGRTSGPRTAFLLPGVGDQYRGVGQGLYREEPAFAEAVDECLAAAAERCGVDLRPVFFAAPRDAAGPGGGTLLTASPDDLFDHAETAHPFLFTLEYALARLLMRRGVQPALLAGYSLGEYAAACLAGVFTLPDALWLVTERARLIEAAPPGRMLAVAAAPEDFAGLDLGPSVDVAALNGPHMTVLSGPPDAVEAAAGRLAEAGIAARALRAAHPFHSSLLRPARDRLAGLVASVPRRAPRIPVVSNATGRVLTDAEATDPGYWAGHLCRPVRFADCVRHCAEQGVTAYVELGPGQTLGGLVRQNVGDARPAVLGTLPAQWAVTEDTDESAALLETCARLWELGTELDWAALRRSTGRLVSLPPYPFRRTRYWPEPSGPDGRQAAPDAQTEKQTAEEKAEDKGEGDEPGRCYAPVWRPDLAPLPDGAAAPGLSGTLVVFSDGGLGTRLADAATAAGTGLRVLEVLPGGGPVPRREGRRLVIDPADPRHHQEVFAAIGNGDGDDGGGGGPLHVAHLWSLREPAGTLFPADDELRTAIRHGFDSLLLTLQALAGRPARLLTVSAGAAEITGGDATAPDRALVHGLARGVCAEYPALSWRGVDVQPGHPGAAGHLLHELRHGFREPGGGPAAAPALAGRRDGRRWLLAHTELPLPDAADAAPPARTCLITGGTRGLGMILARHLARRGVRRLALVSRTGRADTAELTAAGAEVLLISADVGEPEEFRRALAEARARFGTLDMVVHAAGAPGGGLAQRRDPAEAHRVLAPKVLAMGPLAELVGPATPAAERPRLLVLYSSIATVVGGIGEADYCAANSVLDAYGQALAHAADRTQVVTVAWGHWLHDAWADDTTGADRIAYRKRHGFSDEAGCALLDRITASAGGTVVALRPPLEHAVRDITRLNSLDRLMESAAPGNAAATADGTDGAGEAGGGGGGGDRTGRARFPRPPLRTEYVPPRPGLETTVAEVWGEYLGIDRVGGQDPFFDLGGNSLVGMAMMAALERRLGRQIAPALLFAHPTVAALAAALSPSSGPSAPAGAAGGPDGTPAPAAGPRPTGGAARGQRRRARISGSQK